MSQLGLDDIKKLAGLAKIQLTETEEAQYLTDLNNILSHVSSVSNFNETVDKKYYFDSVVKGDSVNSISFDEKILFANIPSKSNDNQVKVPKVIKKSN